MVIGFFGQDPVGYSLQCSTAGTQLNLDSVSYSKDPHIEYLLMSSLINDHGHVVAKEYISFIQYFIHR